MFEFLLPNVFRVLLPGLVVLFGLELSCKRRTEASSVSEATKRNQGAHSLGSTFANAADSCSAALRASSAVCPAKSPPAGLDFTKSESTKVDHPPSISSSRSQTTEPSRRKTWSVTKLYTAVSPLFAAFETETGRRDACGLDELLEAIGWIWGEEEDDGLGLEFGSGESAESAEVDGGAHLYSTERCEFRNKATKVFSGRLVARWKRPW